jgi:hypothetical protein
MPSEQKRKRSRTACVPCRELKRKCDGALPCAACMRFEYDCRYQDAAGASRRVKVSHDNDAAPLRQDAGLMQGAGSPVPVAGGVGVPPPPSRQRLRPLEANSGAAFVRSLALNIDPNNAPRMHLFAWNVFLGARDGASIARYSSRSLINILSQTEMEDFAGHYFAKLHPCYGFLDRSRLEHRIRKRWADPSASDVLDDALLAGVAAIGSIFSREPPPPVELDLVESAKTILERAMSESPTVKSIKAWLLRVIYLRIAGTPHAAWMASCTMMHMIEAAGLHCEPTREAVLRETIPDIDPECRRRLVGLAQHLNTWISFDVGRTKVTLLNTDMMLVKPRSSDYTIELMELLPLAALLDPTMELDGQELEKSLRTVLDRIHREPPSNLARCNLVLCMCRRLQSLNFALQGTLLDQILRVTADAISAARKMVVDGTPWHQVINVPFQILCILLPIDTLASTAQLRNVMVCLSEAAAKWKTNATQEALKTASLLIFIFKKHKERYLANLDEILRSYPLTQGNQTPIQQPEDLGWLDSLMSELPTLQDLFNESEFNEGLAPPFTV